MSDHGPVQPNLVEMMNGLGRGIDDMLNHGLAAKKYGFALLMFEFGDAKPGDRMNYISNSAREDMIAAMKEFIARAEGRHIEFDPTRKQ